MLFYFFYFFYIIQAGTRTIEIELTTLSSTHHVEMNPSDVGFQDRHIVQEIIKEMARNRPIDTKGKRGFKGKKLHNILVLDFMSNFMSTSNLHIILNIECKIKHLMLLHLAKQNKAF